MKLNKISNPILFSLVISLSVLGCKTKSSMLTPLNKGGSAAIGHTAPDSSSTADQGLTANTDKDKAGSDTLSSTGIPDPGLRKNWARDREMFKSDIVHFAYDSSTITESEKSKVAAVADYIKSHATEAVEIEGHCDERGTEEYNRALGERRALALREELITLGVPADRIDTLSFGEDRPMDTAHNEAAYKKNRRGEFILEKPQTLASLDGQAQ